MPAEVTESGRVVAVSIEERRGALTSAVSIGATSLTLDDTSDFDEDGGTLLIGSQVVGYTAVDDDAGTVTLAAAVTAAADAEDWVSAYDTVTGKAFVDKVALVQIEGDEAEGDPVPALVPLESWDRLPEGIRGSAAEDVTIEFDGEDWTVTDIDGLTPFVDGSSVWNPHSSKTATKSIPTGGSPTLVNGWTDVETDGIEFATSTWTITTAGFYGMDLAGEWAKNATGKRQLTIRVNNVAKRQRVEVADATDLTYMDSTYKKRLSVGDTVTIYAFQNSGAALSLTSVSFDIYRISV